MIIIINLIRLPGKNVNKLVNVTLAPIPPWKNRPRTSRPNDVLTRSNECVTYFWRIAGVLVILRHTFRILCMLKTWVYGNMRQRTSRNFSMFRRYWNVCPAIMKVFRRTTTFLQIKKKTLVNTLSVTAPYKTSATTRSESIKI